MTEQERPEQEGQEQQYSQTPPPIPQEEHERYQPQYEEAVEESSGYQQQYGEEQVGGQYQPPHNPAFDPDNKPPQNYMAMNIVATALGLLCCGANCCISLILGIIGIVFANQVNSKYMLGDINGAESSANTAKILGIVSLVLTGLSLIGTIIYYAVIFSSIGGWEGYMEMIQEMVDQMQ